MDEITNARKEKAEKEKQKFENTSLTSKGKRDEKSYYKDEERRDDERIGNLRKPRKHNPYKNQRSSKYTEDRSFRPRRENYRESGEFQRYDKNSKSRAFSRSVKEQPSKGTTSNSDMSVDEVSFSPPKPKEKLKMSPKSLLASKIPTIEEQKGGKLELNLSKLESGSCEKSRHVHPRPRKGEHPDSRR